MVSILAQYSGMAMMLAYFHRNQPFHIALEKCKSGFFDSGFQEVRIL